MSVFSLHILALAGIEILVGLTMIGTLLAVVVFFIGGSKETTATEAQSAISANTLEEIEEILKDPSELSVDEIQRLMERRKEEMERRKMLESVVEDDEKDDVDDVEVVEDGADASEEPENKADEPVMAILQKPGSEGNAVEEKELERQFVEKKLQRIADKRAEHRIGAPDELPSFPNPPKVSGQKLASLATPKPFLHELPQPTGKK